MKARTAQTQTPQAWRGRLIAATLFLLLCLTALPSHSFAQHSTLSPRSSALIAQPSIAVDDQSAVSDFPDKVTFHLKAHGFEAARAQVNYRISGDSITAEEKADLKSPAANLDLKLDLDLNTHYMPPGSEVEYYWTLVDKNGDEVDTPAATVKIVDKQHTWKSLTDSQGRVTVRWYDGSNNFGKALLDEASKSLDRLQTEINAGLGRQAEIWVYSTQEDMFNSLPSNIPEWVGGKAFPDQALVMADIADDEYADLEIRRVVPHELSHLVLYQATRNPYNSPPAWMDEGLAVHNQEVQDPDEAEALQNAAQKGKLIPLKALSGSFGADPDTATLSYAESRSAVEFLLDNFGAEKFGRTVAAFREGVTYDDAFKAGIGITVDEIDAQWRASLPYQPNSQQGQQGQPSSGGKQPSSVGQPRSPFDPTGILLVPLALFVLLFIAGAIVTIALLVFRRKPATATPQPPYTYQYHYPPQPSQSPYPPQYPVYPPNNVPPPPYPYTPSPYATTPQLHTPTPYATTPQPHTPTPPQSPPPNPHSETDNPKSKV